MEALQRGGVDLHYAVHVTGHGWRKFMRAERDLAYVIDNIPPSLPVFDFIEQHAGMSVETMYGTFNMGAGFALFLPQEQAVEAQRVASQTGFELLHAGSVASGDKKVVIRQLGITFAGSSLQIRS